MISRFTTKITKEYKQKFYHLLFIFSFAIACLSTTTATLLTFFQSTDIQIDLAWIAQLSFFYFTPVFLWFLLAPLVINLVKRFPLLNKDKWWIHIVIHLLIAASSAPLIRFIALFIDFAIKDMLGMIEVSVWEVLIEVQHIPFTTAERAFYTYLIIVFSYSGWQLYSTPSSTKQSYLQKIKVHHKEKISIIDLQEVFWISAQGNYILFHTPHTVYRRRGTLNEIQSKLNPKQFYRVHRSNIINRETISSFQHWRRGEYLIQLENEKTLTSSRGFRKEMERLIRSFE